MKFQMEKALVGAEGAMLGELLDLSTGLQDGEPLGDLVRTSVNDSLCELDAETLNDPDESSIGDSDEEPSGDPHG